MEPGHGLERFDRGLPVALLHRDVREVVARVGREFVVRETIDEVLESHAGGGEAPPPKLCHGGIVDVTRNASACRGRPRIESDRSLALKGHLVSESRHLLLGKPGKLLDPEDQILQGLETPGNLPAMLLKGPGEPLHRITDGRLVALELPEERLLS